MTTQTIEEARIEAMVEQLRDRLRSGEVAPGDPLAIEGVSKSLAEMTYVGGSEEDEGMVTIYSTKDGSPSTVPLYFLAKKLRQRWGSEPDIPVELRGRSSWTEKPTMDWSPGNELCLLHPDHPDHDEYQSLGLRAVCSKATIPSGYEVRRHMQAKHKASWELIREAQAERKDASQQETMNALLERLVEQNAAPTRRRRSASTETASEESED